jgi:hypothetical protein
VDQPWQNAPPLPPLPGGGGGWRTGLIVDDAELFAVYSSHSCWLPLLLWANVSIDPPPHTHTNTSTRPIFKMSCSMDDDANLNGECPAHTHADRSLDSFALPCLAHMPVHTVQCNKALLACKDRVELRPPAVASCHPSLSYTVRLTCSSWFHCVFRTVHQARR